MVVVGRAANVAAVVVAIVVVGRIGCSVSVVVDVVVAIVVVDEVVGGAVVVLSTIPATSVSIRGGPPPITAFKIRIAKVHAVSVRKPIVASSFFVLPVDVCVWSVNDISQTHRWTFLRRVRSG